MTMEKPPWEACASYFKEKMGPLALEKTLKRQNSKHASLPWTPGVGVTPPKHVRTDLPSREKAVAESVYLRVI